MSEIRLTAEEFLETTIKFYRQGYEDCQKVVGAALKISCFEDDEKMKEQFLEHFNKEIKKE